MGRPVVHWELWSEEPEKVSDFYSKVFDWNIRHLPDLNYRLVETGGGPGINGGIMKPQQGPWPGNLTFYIDVDDLDAYHKKIEEAGGKMVVHKMEVPGVGCLSLFEDPERRVLGLWQQKKQPVG
jgi:predicted enzyme related to lactoylglutathione lyase